MLFAINEKGDLNIDQEFNTFTNFIFGEDVQTNINIAKTIILTKFKHQNWFRDEFILYKRNTYDDFQIKEYIDNKLDEIFSKLPFIRSKVGYAFLNKGDTFTIGFYYKVNSQTNVSLLFRTIEI